MIIIIIVCPILSLFLFDIAYPKGLQNSMLFIEHYLVGYTEGKKVPLAVSRVYNMLSI